MSRDFWVGAGVAGFALFLLVVLIPFAVVTPKSVQAIVLSPLFWPNILASLLLIGGILQTFMGWRRGDDSPETPTKPARLVMLFILMPTYLVLIPWLGLVMASVLVFFGFLVITQTGRLPGYLTAILLPLALYGFFYHVAGVAIPQGQLVTLP